MAGPVGECVISGCAAGESIAGEEQEQAVKSSVAVRLGDSLIPRMPHELSER